MRENKENLSCTSNKKEYFTPFTSKQMSPLLKHFLQMDSEHVFVAGVKRRE